MLNVIAVGAAVDAAGAAAATVVCGQDSISKMLIKFKKKLNVFTTREKNSQKIWVFRVCLRVQENLFKKTILHHLTVRGILILLKNTTREKQ